jgi:glycosyltransferase involved in cell wall biosynthesis
MTPRRVLLYMHRLSVNNPTGVHRFALGLATALTDAAAPDIAVQFWTGGQKDDPEPAGIDVRHPAIHRRVLHGAWTLAASPALERFTGAADVAHLLTPSFPLPTRAPLVVTVHDLIPFNTPSWHAPHIRFAFERSVRHAARHASMIITPSQVVADDVHEVLGVERERLRVIHEGVDPVFASPVPQSEVDRIARAFDVVPGEFVLTVGEISPRKNCETLFAALSMLARPPVLVVAGARGSQAGDVGAMAAKFGVTERVRLVGRVSDEDLHALMQSARALLHPSLYEGFGLTPVEGMAAGTPTLVSDAGSLPEVVGDASIVLAPRDVDAWAEAIARVCVDDDLVAGLVRRGRLRVAHLTWASTAARTMAVYEEVWS